MASQYGQKHLSHTSPLTCQTCQNYSPEACFMQPQHGRGVLKRVGKLIKWCHADIEVCMCVYCVFPRAGFSPGGGFSLATSHSNLGLPIGPNRPKRHGTDGHIGRSDTLDSRANMKPGPKVKSNKGRKNPLESWQSGRLRCWGVSSCGRQATDKLVLESHLAAVLCSHIAA